MPPSGSPSPSAGRGEPETSQRPERHRNARSRGTPRRALCSSRTILERNRSPTGAKAAVLSRKNGGSQAVARLVTGTFWPEFRSTSHDNRSAEWKVAALLWCFRCTSKQVVEGVPVIRGHVTVQVKGPPMHGCYRIGTVIRHITRALGCRVDGQSACKL